MIFGVGSGRCGTKTLAKILGIPHEVVLMPWSFSATKYGKAMTTALQQGGAVGCYWLPHLERVWRSYPGTKIVCLQREREATCQSWIRHLYGRHSFVHETIWVDPDGSRHAESKFPDYDGVPVEQAAYRYYDDYYALAKQMESDHPEHFRIFDMHAVLNDPKSQKQMWRFVGRPKSKIRCGIRTNTLANPVANELNNRLMNAAYVSFVTGVNHDLDPEDLERVQELSQIVARQQGCGEHDVVAKINLTVKMR